MIKRPFGNSGLEVSALGLGAAQIGQADLDEKEVKTYLNRVLDSGGNLIDTARGYGESERRIGEAISHRRSEFVLSTKIGYGVDGHDDWKPTTLAAGLDRALGLLRTDFVDIVHLHSCPLEVLQSAGFLEAFSDLKKAGKTRLLAYSGENETLKWAAESGVFDSLQTSVNPFDQWSMANVTSQAAARGLGVIAKRAVANFCWKHVERPVGVYGETYWERLHAMNLPTFELPWDEICLRFCAFAPGVACALTGTKSWGHFEANIHTVEKGPLPSELVEVLVSAFAPHLGQWPGEV